VSLRSKLGRVVGAVAPKGPRAPAPAPFVDDVTQAAAVDADDAVEAGEEAARERRVAAPEIPADSADPVAAGDAIASLRARIATLVERSRAKRPAPPPTACVGDSTPLPFDVVERDEGQLHRRLVPHPPGTRVGHVELAPARSVSSRSLAFLALDPALEAALPAGALYLDTETTGLAGGTGTVPFLVGLAWFEGETLVVEQLLLKRFGEEAPLLAHLAERLEAATMIVSYNGKSFDLPLLRTRCVMNRLPPLPDRPHLDLVHVARRVHRTARGGARGASSQEPPREARDARDGPWVERDDGPEGARWRVTSCRLVALERSLLGFERIDDVPSAEIPARFSHFVRTGDGDAIRGVCDHNLLDVISMAALVAAYGGAVERLEKASPSAELSTLHGADLVGLAGTLERAGALPLARRAADAALARVGEEGEGGAQLERDALRARGRIAKRADDVPSMLADFEALATGHGDAEARLELAKAYEHRLRDLERALAHVEAGTSELAPRAEHRRARLERKRDKIRQVELPTAPAESTVPAHPAKASLAPRGRGRPR
jgi:hypothetical protein